jgi:hypothetical protein
LEGSGKDRNGPDCSGEEGSGGDGSGGERNGEDWTGAEWMGRDGSGKDWRGGERKGTEGIGMEWKAMAYVGWCRSGKAPWAALCRAATERECWRLLFDRAARVQFAKLCVLREGERP